MQICQLSEGEAERVQYLKFVPDCHLHKHLSKRDAEQAAADGTLRFISQRAVVAVGPVSPCGYWYDASDKGNDRDMGTARSGAVRTTQIVNFMPRGMKHRVRDIAAWGAQGRSMTPKAIQRNTPHRRSGVSHDELV
jgi:hypothetical protein